MQATKNHLDLRLQVRTEPFKKALCVGVRYHTLAETHAGYQLDSTYADVKRVKTLLTDRFGYREDDIKVLMDDGQHEEPTHDKMIESMKALVAGAQPGDRFVFHFSGHGSQKPNTNGTEKDGKDEAIWPSDVQVRKYEKDAGNIILDDTIKELLVDSIPAGAHLVIIFDCCHSGTAADLPHVHSDHYHISHRQNAFKLNCGDGSKVTLLTPSTSTAGRDALASAISPVSAISPSVSDSSDGESEPEVLMRFPTVVSWAACQDPKRSWSPQSGHNSGSGGLFIRAFVDVLQTYGANASHEKLLHEVGEKMVEYLKESAGPELWEKHQEKLVTLIRPQLGCLHNYPGLLISPLSDVF